MPKETISQRLIQIMNERNLKQIDIIRLTEPYCNRFKIRIGRNDLSQYISGKVEPRQNKIYILAKALDVNEAWLMGFDVPKERKDNDTSLKILRQKANLPLLVLAEQYNNRYNENITPHTLKRIEEGKSTPTGKTLVNLADFFNVSVDYILGRHSADISNTNNLTKNEREHLKLFSMLNNAGQKKASEYISDLLENTKYTQEDEFIDCDGKIYSVDIEDDTTYIAAYGGGIEDDDKTIYHP